MRALGLALLLAWLCTGWGSAVPAACDPILPEAVKAAVRQRVDGGAHAGIVVGLVTPCGRTVYAHGRTRDGGAWVTARTLFEIGSATKVFTGLLLAEMAARGEVALDEPVRNLLPAGVSVPTRKGQEIALVHLATHTSGLPPLPDNLDPADWDNPYADYTVDQLYDFLSHHRLERDIGGPYVYSNLGMGLLGHTLTLRAGTSYEDLVVSRIADVLGMPDTRISLSPAQQARLATGHRDGVPFPNWDLPTLAGAGALRSSARDLLVFLAAELGLVDTPLNEAMQATRRVRAQTGSPQVQVGLAWHLTRYGRIQIVEHHGATGGYWAFLGLSEDAQRGVVVLTNSYGDVDDLGRHVLDPSLPLES